MNAAAVSSSSTSKNNPNNYANLIQEKNEPKPQFSKTKGRPLCRKGTEGD